MILTRAANQQGATKQLLEQRGARVLDLPALVIVPPDDWGPLDEALASLEDFHWLVFSSVNGVQAVEYRLQRLGGGLCRLPSSLKIAAVGRRTARLLKDLGAPADFVPPSFVADSLIDHFPESGWGLTMLLPRVQHGGRTLLAESFKAAGIRVVEVAAYDSRCPEQIAEPAAKALVDGSADAVAFSSGKTALHAAQLLQGRFGNDWKRHLRGVSVVSIGPQTSRSCREHFGRVDAEADPHDMEGLAEACNRAMRKKL
ncbi:uroporphyrinogen-III synthase [Synechococcus sp. M16CYN]